MSGSHQVHVGIKWIGSSLAITQFVRFLTTAVLARLLTPEIFGLVSMAHVAIALIGVIREVGIGTAYVQRPDRNPEDAIASANTTFLMSLAVNSTLFVVAWFAAPLAASFFEADGLLIVLRTMFLVFLIDAFDTTPTMILQKRLEFDKNALAEIVAAALNTVVAISLAYAGFGVWALVAGQLSSRAGKTVFVFFLSGFRPSLIFDLQIARELFNYGRYLWAFAILSAVGGSLDKLILGRFSGAATLGVYDMAANLANLPATHISSLVNQITFPSFSILQGDLPALRSALYKTIRHVTMISVPMAFGIMAVAHDLILTVYGEKWMAAVPIVRILAFFGLSLSVSSITGPILKAIGKPQLLFYSSLLHHAVLAVMLLTLARQGAVGIAYAVLTPMVVSAIVAYGLIIHYIEFPIKNLLGPLLRTGIPAFLMYLAVGEFDARFDAAYDFAVGISLIASIVVGGLVYVALSAIFNRADLTELVLTLQRALMSRRGAATASE